MFKLPERMDSATASGIEKRPAGGASAPAPS